MFQKNNAPAKRKKFSAGKLLKFSGILCVCIYAAFVLVKQQITLSALDADKQKERENIAAANLENQALEDEYNKAQSDEEYIEQAIRKNLGFVKPNERVFIDISRSH